MVPFDQPDAALVSCLHGSHPPENVLTNLYVLAGHAYEMDYGYSSGIMFCIRARLSSL